MNGEDPRILRLAARLLRHELDFHSWAELQEVYGELLASLDKEAIELFVERHDPPPGEP